MWNKGIALLLIVTGGLAHAQMQLSTPPGPPPPFLTAPIIEDRELYYAFFNYLQGLITTQLSGLAAGPQSTASQQIAALLGINSQDISALSTNVQQIASAYANLASERQTFTATPAGSSTAPNQAQMGTQFELKRARITADGILSLSKALSPSSWARLHSFVIGTYSTSIYKK